MATLIPSLGAARFDSRGELRLAERLKDFLEENTYIWHNLPMGPRGRHPDFVIVHPSNGLLVLEVKDWRLDTIASATKSDVELITNRGVVKETSPFEQARRYMFDVVQQIQKDGQLLFPPGHAFQGKAIVPFGYGVVFTNITRKQFAQTDLHEVFPEDRCVFKDEMTESTDADVFRERLWEMVPQRLGPALTLPEFDRLPALLFPEIRIRQIGLPLEAKPGMQEDRTLAVMDLQRAAVRLLSMHAAKGLEFACVAVGRLEAVGRHGEDGGLYGVGLCGKNEGDARGATYPLSRIGRRQTIDCMSAAYRSSPTASIRALSPTAVGNRQ